MLVLNAPASPSPGHKLNNLPLLQVANEHLAVIPNDCSVILEKRGTPLRYAGMGRLSGQSTHGWQSSIGHESGRLNPTISALLDCTRT